MEKLIMVEAKDIDTNRYQLADMKGYTKKADAYVSIAEQGLKDCTVYYVSKKNCFAIVAPKNY